MDLGFSSEEQSFREEVRAFCKAKLPGHIRRKLVLQQRLKYEDYAEWQRILDDQGWAVPHWPAEWGGQGWSAMKLYIFNEELQQFPAPPPDMHNGSLLGPVLMATAAKARWRQRGFIGPRLWNQPSHLSGPRLWNQPSHLIGPRPHSSIHTS